MNEYRGAWVEPKPTDWVAGGESAIVYESRVDHWFDFLPTRERQSNEKFDSNMCVTYSGLNCLESQLIYLIKKGLLPPAQLKFLEDEGYLDENGLPNLNEAFCAKLNGTTIAGNHLGAFWDGIRKYGAIPQKDWIDMSTATEWADLMKEIPEALLAKGRRFKEMFEINYEWVLLGQVKPETLAYQVKHAPLHIAAPVCPTWNTGDVKVCELTKLQHATMIFGALPAVNLRDLDHYNPFEKVLEWNYYIPYAIKGIIKAKVAEPIVKPTHVFTKPMKMGETSDEVKALQEALRYFGSFKHPINTGYYGRITADAVRAFQYRYQVAAPSVIAEIDGKNVGPATRAKLNELLA